MFTECHAYRCSNNIQRFVMIGCKAKCSGIANKKMKIHVPKCLSEGVHRRTGNTMANRTRGSVG